MMRLVDDLLILARSNQPLERDLFVVDLNACVTAAIEPLREDARSKNVALDVRQAEVPDILGNPDQIERIIANLLQNAIRYTPANGTVTVASANDRTGPLITVSDTGTGIPAEDLGHIFERFWRSDESRTDRHGTGLGLTIARELGRRHGAEITVSSTVGVGSTFSVLFPLRAPLRVAAVRTASAPQ